MGDVAAEMRCFLEPLWGRWKAETGRFSLPDAASTSMCGFTSAFMARALAELDDGEWRVAGGWPPDGGGLTCPGGRLNAHFWTTSSDGIIVDLTADQFGLPCVIVTRLGDGRFAESFSQEDVERHLPRVMPLVEEWIELARDRGLLPETRRFAA